MHREEDKDQIIFRRRVVQKAGILTYPEGEYFKHPHEVEKASVDADILEIVDEHTGSIVGYGFKPQFGEHYRNGRAVRDLHYIKELMNEEQIKNLNDREQIELSMQYDVDIVDKKGQYNDKSFDGMHKNMAYEHIAWTREGRADENYGVGIRVMDSKIKDSVRPEIIDDSVMTDCVKKKIAILKKEDPSLTQKQLLGKAYGICKQTKGDSRMSDNENTTPDGTDTTPPSGDQDNQDNIETIVKGMAEQITSLAKSIEGLKPKGDDSTEDQGEGDQTPPDASTIDVTQIKSDVDLFKQQNEAVTKQITDLTTLVKDLAESVKALDVRTTPTNKEINLGELIKKENEKK